MALCILSPIQEEIELLNWKYIKELRTDDIYIWYLEKGGLALSSLAHAHGMLIFVHMFIWYKVA